MNLFSAPEQQTSAQIIGVLKAQRKPAASLSNRLIQVYTDGGARPSNPGPSGWGLVVVQEGVSVEEASGFIGHGTNQIAELVAAIAGLLSTPVGAKVELISDSQYVVKGISEWRKGWERRGWRNAAGEPVANKTFWQHLFALVDERQVRTRWVKGHAGDVFNEQCDKLATEAITQGISQLAAA
jgi:ribonuclease HI